jgi:NADPH:quinone reductase and related Zn-dependent oxidoreductases
MIASPTTTPTMPEAIPAVMHYVLAREPGPPDVLALAETATPAPKPGEVLIAVAYAGVNRPDCIQRAGNYPPPPDASPIIGLEVAGTVVALGESVTDCRLGDQVCALTPGGGYAEYCAAPAPGACPIRKACRRSKRRACRRTTSPSGTTSSTASI